MRARISSRGVEAALDGSAELERIARRLGARAPRGKGARRLPTLWLFTDPDRTPDAAAAAARLPRGAGVVFRGFGRPDAEARARELATAASSRGLVLLVGLDARLAAAVGADGVHLPERALHLAPRLRRARPGWIVTGAAHSAGALHRAAMAGLDAAFLSAAFPSRSPSAGRPLGPVRLAQEVGRARLPVIALGGVDARTARRAAGAGVTGVAAVKALSGPAVRT